jgi:hypothetical protein
MLSLPDSTISYFIPTPILQEVILGNQKSFSRAYLQTLPEVTICTKLDSFVSQFKMEFLTKAREGYTSHEIELDLCKLKRGIHSPPNIRCIVEEDVVAAFLRLFTGCTVTWKETTKEDCKLFQVDWS